MTGDRICILSAHFRQHHIDWQKSKSAYARELQSLMAGTITIAPEHLKPIASLKGAPMPYEVRFGMKNASDCEDWLKDNEAPVTEVKAEVNREATLDQFYLESKGAAAKELDTILDELFH